MTRTVWITRTQPLADETSEVVKALGFSTVIAPLLDISVVEKKPQEPKSSDIIIFTSRNGVRAFCALCAEREFDVVTVGEATAQSAREAGFTRVLSADGTSRDIAPLIVQNFKMDRHCIHASGLHIRGQITQELVQAGFRARRDLYYLSKPISSFPDIDVTTVSDILVFSPLAAKTLSEFVAAGLAEDISQCRIISISAATDKALGGLICAQRLIAPRPTQQAMLTTLAP